MTTKEAIQAMLDGNKLTSDTWVNGEFIYFDGECFREEDGCPMPLSDISEVSETLKIYEEPKPKQTVTIEKWLCLNGGFYFTLEGSFDFINDYNSHILKVKLLDTYEVEL